MRWLAIPGIFFALTGCGGGGPATNGGPSDGRARAVFSEIARESGLDFVHFNGMSGEFYMLEVFGAGCALFDYDKDGDLDAYLLQGHMLGEGKDPSEATFPPPSLPRADRLYRNDLVVHPDGTRTLRFTDVTVESGIRGAGYGMGVAAGDYDNDGWTDLYVTNWGANRMWRNGGDGTFTDVTEQTGTADTSWGASAVFLDYDGDGWLDLYATNYLDFEYPLHTVCKRATGGTDWCGPVALEGVSDKLFHNRGDGAFEDVSDSSGIGSVAGNGLGVVTTDFDGDGRIDIYVANDGMENLLWRNLGDGTFRDDALVAGCALNRKGRPEAGMGVDAGDFDNDGDEDLFLAHLSGETNTLYVNGQGGIFDDRTMQVKLGAPGLKDTGFGTAWLDYDNDGRLDVFVANGDVRVMEALAGSGEPYPLHQPNRLLRNGEDGQFTDVSERAGPALRLREVSRGVSVGDVDNDGDTDLLILNNSGPVRLLSNEIGAARNWLGLRLVGTEGGRDMLGARVEVVRGDGRSLWHRARTDGSYCSSRDPRVLVGLGNSEDVPLVRVHWPDGVIEEWTDLETGRYTTLRQGSGSRGT